MRIAMFSESYLPRISGVVHSLTAFVTSLRADGHRVLVVAPRVRGYHDNDPDVLRYPSVPTPQYDFPLGIPYAPAAWRVLMAHELDVVHAHAPFTMGRAAARLARRRGLPLVFTHHTLYDAYVHYAPGPASLLRPLARWYTTRYANRCDCVIAPSRALVARLRAQGVRSRIEVLPTAALDLQLFGSLDPSWVRPEFGLPPDRPLLVTASRLGKEKSVDLVLQAFAQVIRRRDALRDGVTGFLVPPSAAALAEKVIDLLDDATLRRTMAVRAKEVAQEFALPALTRRLVEIYQSLLPARRR